MVGGMTGYSQFDASLWILGGNGSMCWDTDCSILRTCSRTKLHHVLDAFLLGGYWCGGMGIPTSKHQELLFSVIE